MFGLTHRGRDSNHQVLALIPGPDIPENFRPYLQPIIHDFNHSSKPSANIQVSDAGDNRAFEAACKLRVGLAAGWCVPQMHKLAVVITVLAFCEARHALCADFSAALPPPPRASMASNMLADKLTTQGCIPPSDNTPLQVFMNKNTATRCCTHNPH